LQHRTLFLSALLGQKYTVAPVAEARSTIPPPMKVEYGPRVQSRRMGLHLSFEDVSTVRVEIRKASARPDCREIQRKKEVAATVLLLLGPLMKQGMVWTAIAKNACWSPGEGRMKAPSRLEGFVAAASSSRLLGANDRQVQDAGLMKLPNHLADFVAAAFSS